MQIATQIVLEWPVFAAYEVAPSTDNDDLEELRRWGVKTKLPSEWSKVIRARGGQLGTPRRVLDIHPTLYRQFAQLPYEPQAYLKFARTFGTLSHHPQRLVEWALFHSMIRQLLGLGLGREPLCVKPWRTWFCMTGCFENPEDVARIGGPDAFEWKLNASLELNELLDGGLGPQVKTTEDGRPLLALNLRDLRTGIALQALRSLTAPAAGLETRQCAQCGTYFEIGPGTGRRSTSKFCSPRCQGAYRYARQKLLKDDTG